MCTCCSTDASSSPAEKSWPWNSKREVTRVWWATNYNRRNALPACRFGGRPCPPAVNWRHGCRATCRQDACATCEEELNMIATRSIETMKETDPYLAKFDELIAPTAGRHPSWVFPLRKAGMARFAE